LPTTLTTFSGGQASRPGDVWILANFGPGQPLYLLFFAAMIIFFTYFYTLNVSFKTDDVADNLKNQNGFIPGIRPGKKTSEYLEYVVNRVLVLGSAYLALRLPDARDRAHAAGDHGLFRRHLDPDHRVGGDGHGAADPVTPACAPVRRACWRKSSCAEGKAARNRGKGRHGR
jgi:hypothetical protein